MAMARMRRVCLASAVRAAAARNCEILRFWRVISIADMLPAPRINDVLHRVTLAAVWESPQESGSQAVGIIYTSGVRSTSMFKYGLEPDSKDNYRASRLTAIWMQANVTKAARVPARFS